MEPGCPALSQIGFSRNLGKKFSISRDINTLHVIRKVSVLSCLHSHSNICFSHGKADFKGILRNDCRH
jgi:hypothetical protein